jgi:preprotein translocase subunit SecG
MLQAIVLVAHVGVALMIIGLVLLQRGKGAEAGTGFGAGASGTVFGARGSANFLSRATGVLVTVFFITSLTLAYLATQRTAPRSLLDDTATEQGAAPQAAPAPASELPAVPNEAPGAGSTPSAGGASPDTGAKPE